MYLSTSKSDEMLETWHSEEDDRKVLESLVMLGTFLAVNTSRDTFRVYLAMKAKKI